MKIYGYDIGGAEWPADPENLTIVDNVDPSVVSGSHEWGYVQYKWIETDLNGRFGPGCWAEGLEPRPVIVVSKILRYIDNKRDLARNVQMIWSHQGTMRILDHLAAIEPFLEVLLNDDESASVSVKELNLTNPSYDEAGEVEPAEWEVLLDKYDKERR